MQQPCGILLIETSGLPGRVGLILPGGQPLHRTLQTGQRHARDLLVAIRDLASEAKIELKTLAGIALSIGPGGYTGLRVGLTAAKTLAFALRVPLHAIPTFDWLREIPGKEYKQLILVSDALKGQVYSEIVEVGQDGFASRFPLNVRPLADVLNQVRENTLVMGEQKLRAAVPEPISMMERELLSAEQIFKAMVKCVDSGKYVSPQLSLLEPLYLRGSSAEEKAKEMQSQIKIT